jgi:hypothetical protein
MLAVGRSPLAGLVEVDETEIACRSNDDPVKGGGGRSRQGKMLFVGVVGATDASVQADPHETSRPLLGRQPPCLSRCQPRPWLSRRQLTGRAIPAPPRVTHLPIVVGKMAAYIVLPWVFPNPQGLPLALFRGLRRKHFQSYLD